MKQLQQAFHKLKAHPRAVSNCFKGKVIDSGMFVFTDFHAHFIAVWKKPYVLFRGLTVIHSQEQPQALM